MENPVTQGYEAKLQYNPAMPIPLPSGTGWTEVADIVDLKPHKIEAEDIDSSTMQSPDQFKEFGPGWATAGEIDVKIHFSKQQNATMYGLFRVKQSFMVVFADGSYW